MRYDYIKDHPINKIKYSRMQKRHTYDLGMIGNGAFNALIGKDTNVQWMCLPRFDSSFVFGGLVDEKKGGEFQIAPVHGKSSFHQYYLENTNVLVSEIETEDGKYRVTDFAPRFFQHDRYYKPTQLIRKVEALSGSPKILVKCNPKGHYGEVSLTKERGSSHLRFHGLEEPLRLTTDIPLNYIIEEQPFVISHTMYLVLSYGAPFEAGLQETVESFLTKTVNYWRLWVKSTSIRGRFQKEVIRSSLALKIMQYEDTGGIIAAPTTSLSEFPNSTRNWDYRYCWMRDAYYTLSAFSNIGHFEEMEKYFHYITNIILKKGDRIQPLYSITGEPKLTEKELPLAGYMNNQPVRIGNDAYTHIQNDVYGQIMLTILPVFDDKRFVFDERADSHELLTHLSNYIEKTIDELDAGIWEFRGREQQHAYTNLFQWAGASAIAKVAKGRNYTELYHKAIDLQKRAVVKIEECFDAERGVYTQAKGVKHMDASNLQLILMNYLDPNSEKARQHLKVMEQELKTKEGLFYRYKHADDFGEPETTFLICGFWYSEALAAVGRTDEAIEVFEKLCSYSNHVGLMSEDIAPADGGMWGNFPQAYSHVGLVNAAYRIYRRMDTPSFL